MSMSCLSSPHRSCALKLLSTQRPQSSITYFRYVVLDRKIIQSALHLQQHGQHRVSFCATAVPQCHSHTHTWLCNVLSVCAVQLPAQYILHLDHWPTSLSLLLCRTHQDWCTDRPVCAFQITSQSRTMPILPGSRTPRAAHPCLPLSITGWMHASFSSTPTT